MVDNERHHDQQNAADDVSCHMGCFPFLRVDSVHGTEFGALALISFAEQEIELATRTMMAATVPTVNPPPRKRLPNWKTMREQA